jgi:putative selenium metabolism protein SsnA
MIVLRNATVAHLDPAEVRSGVDVVLKDSEIFAVGDGAASALAGAGGSVKQIDCSGKLVMPGLVCGHNHFYSGLSRGITAKIAPSEDFVSTLGNLWWRLDRVIDGEILAASGLVCAIEALKAGCTAVVDHHASPSFITGSLDVLEEAFEKTGLRGILCYETTDRNGRGGMEEGIAENARFARRVKEKRKSAGKSGTVEAMIGGHAPFTLPDEGLRALGDIVRETGRGFHVHAAEDAFDPSFSHRFHGKDTLERLDGFGLLTGASIIAHGLYLSARDRELLSRRDAFLAHNSRSNMNNHVGYNERLADTANVVLGTDGIGSDMLEELKFAYFKHRDAGGPLWPGDFARFLQRGNEVLGRCFKEKFGRIAEGFKADIVVLDYKAPTPLSGANLAGHLVFGAGSSDVETVVVDGKIVMENRRFGWDVSQAYARAREAAGRLWSAMDRL